MAEGLEPASGPAHGAARAAEDAERTRGDRLYATIFECIVGGEFAAGERLPSETALAARFGVSRPLIREALARLRDHGIIHSRRGSGSFVQHCPPTEVLRFAPVGSIADIQRCFEFRTALEGRAAALAAERREPRSLALIEAAVAELERIIAAGEVGVAADFAFHVAVAAAARNAYFERTIAMLAEAVRVGMTVTRNLSLLKQGARLRLVQDEHLAVVAAIQAGDAEAAELAMIAHIDNARRRMFEG